MDAERNLLVFQNEHNLHGGVRMSHFITGCPKCGAFAIIGRLHHKETVKRQLNAGILVHDCSCQISYREVEILLRKTEAAHNMHGE